MSNGGPPPGRFKIALYVAGMLVFGSLNTITTKIQFTMSSVGVDGKEEMFKKPWFGTYNMFTGMFSALVCHWLLRLCKAGSLKADLAAPILDHPAESGISYRKKVLLVSIPAAFDLAATGLCCVGMLYIPASVWQMLRGCEIVFAAILAITFLQRRMYGFNWLGLLLCVIGVTCVSLSNVWGGSASPGASQDQSELILGMSLVVLGQVVQAAQVIAEEWLLKDVDLPEIEIVGYEGFWGLLMMTCIVYPTLFLMPGNDHGHEEDPIDALVMMYNNPALLSMILVYTFSCATYNVTGIAVTGALSAVHRTMLEASRTTIIWGFGLAVHEFDSTSSFGEALNPWSWLQLVGFLVLMLGQSVYGEMLRVPGLYYPPPANMSKMLASPGALLLSSPLPREREH
eukprot:TRINITY_DN33326_c0_g1_i1.p1 TRINITY_DN33326_c0_g1~~TRINITY_DN33326_c0_g1_i1.p1  ORF type:complete len:399 (-),score=49.23 TRINITY_DN33326_c0_g1_i1:149-1345(-)